MHTKVGFLQTKSLAVLLSQEVANNWPVSGERRAIGTAAVRRDPAMDERAPPGSHLAQTGLLLHHSRPLLFPELFNAAFGCAGCSLGFGEMDAFIGRLLSGHQYTELGSLLTTPADDPPDLSVWPNQTSRANSDGWLAENHDPDQ